MPETRALRCAVLRGGTSRGLFFRSADLPGSRADVEPLLLNVFGSPDIRQINGLGGATSVTSKAAIVGPASRADADVDYTFAQVGVGDPVVDWGGNCGNISSAVGPFAIDDGMVPAGNGTAQVRIHNTNTSKIIVAHVPVAGGRARVEGSYAIPGVPGTGARVDLDFVDPGGSVTGRLLPTGQPVEEFKLADGRTLTVSVVDVANPVTFVLAAQLGLAGDELPDEIEARTDVTEALEEVRGMTAELLGIVGHRSEARSKSPGLPKVGMVAPPSEYMTSQGEVVAARESDLSARVMTMQTAHQSYMVAGAICTAAAAFVEGSVVHQVVRPAGDRPDTRRIRLAHPAGVMDLRVEAGDAGDGLLIESVRVGRTARHIMDGYVWVPERLLGARSGG